jgi:hypothetical protein
LHRLDHALDLGADSAREDIREDEAGGGMASLRELADFGNTIKSGDDSES